MFNYKAQVIRITDGDTLVLDIDFGFDLHQTHSIRLYGINAPELHGTEHDAGMIAKQFLTQYLPVGTIVELDSIKDKSEKHGSYLGMIYRPGDLISINQLMIQKGYAQTYQGMRLAEYRKVVKQQRMDEQNKQQGGQQNPQQQQRNQEEQQQQRRQQNPNQGEQQPFEGPQSPEQEAE